jgi:ATP phosphoribosyltransferase
VIFIKRKEEKSIKEKYIGQQVLRAVIADVSGITNITDIADVADIVMDIVNITEGLSPICCC